MSSTTQSVSTVSRASSFLGSIGVETHLDYTTANGDANSPYANLSTVQAALAYLNPNGVIQGDGINTIRDDTWAPSSELTTLGKAGYKLDIYAAYNATGSNQAATAINALKPLVAAGYVRMIEGPLEVDNSGFGLINDSAGYTALNGTTYTGWNAAIEMQKDLQTTFGGSTPVAMFSLAVPTDGSSTGPAASAMKSLGLSESSLASYGNVHFYQHNGQAPSVEMAGVISSETGYSSGQPFIISETGFNDLNQSGTNYYGTAAVNGVYTLDLVLDAFKSGSTLTDIYELFDEKMGYTGSEQFEDHWGLFNSDGTPKAAATYLRNLVSITGDAGSNASTFATASQPISVTGLPSSGNTLLLEKSDGTYDLVVWSNASIDTNGTVSTAAAQSVSVNLGAQAGSVSVFDPTQGTSAIQTLSNTSTVSLQLADHPLIVQFKPGAASTTTTTGTATTGTTTTGTSTTGAAATGSSTTTATPPATTTGSTGASTTTTPSPITLGSGSDTISLSMSEDAYNGDAQVIFLVDGVQVGGTQTITASHAAGQSQTINLQGNWGSGTHTVGVDFLNDSYGGTATTDRNAYVTAASYDGTAASNATLSLMSSGTQSLTVGTAATASTAPAAVTLGSGSDSIDLKMSEDAWQGNGQFTVSVDGTQIGGTQTVTASHAAGQTQDFIVQGNFGAGSHSVSVNFLNDAYGGTSTTDRNIYVNSVTVDGQAQSGSLALMSSGAQSLPITVPGASTGSGTLVLNMSEDAYQGDAQFTVSVDGKQVGGTYTATASHAAGQSSALTLTGNWGAGSHSVAIDFLNDAYGGTASTDRNLYVTGASINGTAQSGVNLSLMSSGTQSFTATTSTTYNEGAAGGNVTTLGNDIVKIGAGNVTINAQGPSASVTGGAGTMTFIAHGGNDTLTAGTGASTVTGGTGMLTFTEGKGASSVTLGSGKAVFDFVNGQAGGAITIANFVPGTDVLHLQGYSGTGVASERVSGGATVITLTDKTSITLSGVTDPYTHSVFG